MDLIKVVHTHHLATIPEDQEELIGRDDRQNIDLPTRPEAIRDPDSKTRVSVA